MLQVYTRNLPVLFCLIFLSIAANSDTHQSERIGFEVFLSDADVAIGIDTAIISYSGMIDYPMAENLAEIWSELKGRFLTIILHLNSEGGELGEAKRVIAILKGIRDTSNLKTLVYHGERCLSACIPVFMQGEERIAGGASAWMFHGACRKFTNIPSVEHTDDYIGMLIDAGVSDSFLCSILERHYLTKPGEFWSSGYELFHVHNANVITRLLTAWHPRVPVELPFDPLIRSR